MARELGKSVLKGENITKVFGYGKTRTEAVKQVNFDFHEGEVISIVGESGSGKTTIARMILGLINITEGTLYFNGQPRDISNGKKRKEYWKNIQAVFPQKLIRPAIRRKYYVGNHHRSGGSRWHRYWGRPFYQSQPQQALRKNKSH